MSFRELRSFTETMRILGYPKPISVESFRVPNIELVCEIVFWLVRRYEPSAELAFRIELEDERIDFVRRVCDIVLAKSRIRLNPKKIYQADGYAVQEMAKVANLLKQAVTMRRDDETDYSHLQTQVAQRNVQDAKRARTLCAELTQDGSNLYFMLEDERSARPQRERVLSRATDVSEFERRLRDQLQFVAQQVEQTQDSLSNLASDESNLEQKIEANKTQLERKQKSLNAQAAVKPQFMEDYAVYENQLRGLFVHYLEHYRNLEYLEHVLAKLNKVEDELLAEQEQRLRAMRERLRQEEISVLRGGADFVDGVLAGGGDGGASGDSPQGMTADQAAVRAAQLNAQRTDFSRGDLKRPRAASGRQRPPDAAAVAQANSSATGGAGGAQAFGSLGAGGGANKIQLDDEDSDLVANDDDTDDSDDDDDDDSSDDDSDDDDSGDDDDSDDDKRKFIGGGDYNDH